MPPKNNLRVVGASKKCLQRPRNKWSEQEIQALHEALEELSSASSSYTWAEVAARVPGRDAKQCRSRYMNHCMDLNTGPWEHIEDLIIASEHAIQGSCWSKAAKLLEVRSENQVKNYWNSMYRSKTMYRPCSALWYYIQQLFSGQQSGRAFQTAVELWQKVIPEDLAMSVLSQFRSWQQANQPDGIAVKLPEPSRPEGPPPVTSEAAAPKWHNFRPQARYHPTVLANLSSSVRVARISTDKTEHSKDMEPDESGSTSLPQQGSYTASIPVRLQGEFQPDVSAQQQVQPTQQEMYCSYTMAPGADQALGFTSAPSAVNVQTGGELVTGHVYRVVQVHSNTAGPSNLLYRPPPVTIIHSQQAPIAGIPQLYAQVDTNRAWPHGMNALPVLPQLEVPPQDATYVPVIQPGSFVPPPGSHLQLVLNGQALSMQYPGQHRPGTVYII